MSGSFLGLFIFCTALIVVQELAVLPWLLAFGSRTRQRLREPMFWLQGAGIAVGLGLIAAYFLNESSDPTTLRRWGRFYMAVLHLQLGADLFVGGLAALLTFWPKGGA